METVPAALNLLMLLAEVTGFSWRRVRKIARTASERYVEFTVPKPDGSRRVITRPDDSLKALQKALAEVLEPILPIHPAATAYRKGSSIKQNAQAHANARAIRTYDFSAFFPSLVAKDWQGYCTAKGVFDSHLDLQLTTDILFTDAGDGVLRLGIGDPAAPLVANALLYGFDDAVSRAIESHGIRYTRYADDLTFSGKSAEQLVIVDDIIANALASCECRNLMLNPSKTMAAAYPEEMRVTGLAIGGGRVGLDTERRAKFLAAFQKAADGSASDNDMAQLKWQIAFAANVDPEFVSSIDARYGEGAVRRIQIWKPATG